MRTPASRYAAWCRRQGTMQCSPWAVGVVIFAVIALMARHQLQEHWTGVVQIAAGAGAGLACLAAAGLVVIAMRIVDATPAPVTLEPETVPASRKSAVITALTLTPEDAAEMQADADALADGTLDLTFTERGSLFELREPEDAP